jgi:hypothetical protein
LRAHIVAYSRSDDTKKDRFEGKFRDGKRMVEETQKEGLTEKRFHGLTKGKQRFPGKVDEESYALRHVGGTDVSLSNGELAIIYDAIEPRTTGTLVFVTEGGDTTTFDVASSDVGNIMPIGVREVKMSESDLAEGDIVLYKRD